MYRPLIDDGIVRRIVEAAAAAPSIHNTQPWRFRVAGGDLMEVHADPGRVLWVADPRGRALHLSCGAALFNVRLAIRMTGAKPLVWPLPGPGREPALGSRPDREPSPVRDLGRASPVTVLPTGSYEPRPHLAVLATAHDHPADWLRAGQALQRVLLTATSNGLSASFLYQSLELHDRRPSEPGWWPWPECPQIVLRLGYGPSGALSPRRRVDEVLDCGPDA